MKDMFKMTLAVVALMSAFILSSDAYAAIIPVVATKPAGLRTAIMTTWAAMATNDTGAPVNITGYHKKSIASAGTYGGATITWQCSHDNTTWYTCLNQANAALTQTSTGISDISTSTVWVRPNVTGGTSVAITASMIAF